MRWYSGVSAAASFAAKAISITGLLLLPWVVIGLLPNPVAMAMTSSTDSHVEVQLCQDADSPDLTIHEPANGALLTHASTVLC
jgi:hypothetical protein